MGTPQRQEGTAWQPEAVAVAAVAQSSTTSSWARLAGCVIARRLVDAGRTVALIEAGGPDYNPAIHQPNRSWELWNSPEDWAYTTEPQQHSLKTSVFWPRGKVLGGSSALNGMIYIRGAKSDFDNWAYNGAPGWSYADVLPYFKKSEDFEDGPSDYHGVGGPLPVTRIKEPNPVTVAMIEAGGRARRPGQRRPQRRGHPRRRPDPHDGPRRPPDVGLDGVRRARYRQPAAHRHHQCSGRTA